MRTAFEVKLAHFAVVLSALLAPIADTMTTTTTPTTTVPTTTTTWTTTTKTEPTTTTTLPPTTTTEPTTTTTLPPTTTTEPTTTTILPPAPTTEPTTTTLPATNTTEPTTTTLPTTIGLTTAVPDVNECVSLPCYPFGKCTDLTDGYNCTCVDGFTYVSPLYCAEINECDVYSQQHFNQSPCLNGGVCQDIINGTYCDCIQNQRDFTVFGDQCEQRTQIRPILTGLSRAVGIEAGGSAITVTGTGFNIIPPIGVYLNNSSGGSNFDDGALFGYVQENSVANNSFVFLTPKANESFIGVQLQVTVLFSGGVKIAMNASVTFTYVKNPSISDINPKTQLVTGGITLTVTGTSLNAVSTPMMTVTLRITYHNETHNSSHLRPYPAQKCFGASDSNMKCPTPLFNLDPENDVHQPNVETSRRKRQTKRTKTSSSGLYSTAMEAISTLLTMHGEEEEGGGGGGEGGRGEGAVDGGRRPRGSRGRREAPMAEFSAAGNRSVQLFLKITLDNYPKYEDVKAALPGINFTLVSPKIVFRSDANGQSRSFDSTKDDPLSIVGSNLLYGLSEEDYRVNVGVGLCNITGVTDNAIACLAPSVRPHNGNDTPVYCEKFPDHLAVMVTAALKYNYFAYCIRYSDTGAEAVESSVFLIVGLCVGVGGSVLLLVAIALAVAIRRKQTKKKKKKKKKKIQRQRQSPTNSTDQDSNSRREPYTRSIELNSYGDRLDQNAIGDLNDGPYYGRRLYDGDDDDDDDRLGSRPGFQGSRQSHETTADVSRNARRNPDGKPLSLAFHGDGSKRFSWTRGARHGDYDVQIAENAKSNYATSFPKVPRPARPSKGGESNNYHKNLHDYSRNIPMQREFKSIDEDYAS